jgi:hypothetical protein
VTVCEMLSPASCSAAAGVYYGDNVPCASVQCAPMTGACCFSRPTTPYCVMTRPNDCSMQGGMFSGLGTVCPTCTFACYANCDNSTTPPVLNLQDFVCFLNRFVSGSPWANCDNSTTPPILNLGDFVCFLNRFGSGC